VPALPASAARSSAQPSGRSAMAQTGRVFQFKLVLLGDSAVGKSSLVLRFVRGQFFEYQESTIGAAFLTQTVALNDTTVKFEIWDTAGQERYHSLAPMYYRGAAAAIVVYDITNRDTFQRAKQWVKELQRQGNPNIVIALAGNKSDLNSKRKVEPGRLNLTRATTAFSSWRHLRRRRRTSTSSSWQSRASCQRILRRRAPAGKASSSSRRAASPRRSAAAERSSATTPCRAPWQR